MGLPRLHGPKSWGNRDKAIVLTSEMLVGQLGARIQLVDTLPAADLAIEDLVYLKLEEVQSCPTSISAVTVQRFGQKLRVGKLHVE